MTLPGPPVMIPERTYYRPDEAAAYADVSIKTVYRWIADGRLQASRTLGGRLRIHKDDIASLVRYES